MVNHGLAHPDVHAPWSKWSEEQILHLVLVYSNPFRWVSRRKSFNDCRRHMQTAPNVELHVIELAYEDRPFEVTDPDQDPNDIQLRSTSVIWHKENLINLAVQRFPNGYKYGGYWDGDFTCIRHDWALEAIHTLKHFQFVQLFNVYADLLPEGTNSWTGARPYRMNSSFAWNYLHQDEFMTRHEKWLQRQPVKVENAKLNKIKESCYGIAPPGLKEGIWPFGLAPGATGGGWAWRRQAFETVGGLLDRCALGSGDWHMAFGLTGKFGLNIGDEQAHCTKPYIDYVNGWINRAALLDGHPTKSVIGCIDNFAVHHFHGSKLSRAYGERWQILQSEGYDPFHDVILDSQGVLRWAGNKPRLRDRVRRYFLNRDEDGATINEKPMI